MSKKQPPDTASNLRNLASAAHKDGCFDARLVERAIELNREHRKGENGGKP